jgi:hypothetical protein
MILNWDHLLRKGFVGPSRCNLFHETEETLNHLLGNCKFMMQLWDLGATKFRRTDLKKDNVIEMVEFWRNNPSKNSLINISWEIFPRILMWNVWKERNRRIFKDKFLTRNQVWEIINRNVKESIGVI